MAPAFLQSIRSMKFCLPCMFFLSVVRACSSEDAIPADHGPCPALDDPILTAECDEVTATQVELLQYQVKHTKMNSPDVDPEIGSVIRRDYGLEASGIGGGVGVVRTAFATLLYGDDPIKIMEMRMMLRSLRDAGSKSEQIALIPEGDSAHRFHALLEQDGIHVVTVPKLVPPCVLKNIRSNFVMDPWSYVFSKFYAWNLTQYAKIALVDADMLALPGTVPDRIFEICSNSQLCMVSGSNPYTPCVTMESRNSNSGLMVFTPSSQRLASILDTLGKDTSSTYRFAEQSFLARYIANVSNGMQVTNISSYWNSCSCDIHPELDPTTVRGSLAEALGHGIYHFCGTVTPSRCAVCSNIGDVADTCAAHNLGERAKAYNVYISKLLDTYPCLGKQGKKECDLSSKCKWCEASMVCWESTYNCPDCLDILQDWHQKFLGS